MANVCPEVLLKGRERQRKVINFWDHPQRTPVFPASQGIVVKAVIKDGHSSGA